jgi:hypothetical protein
VSSGHGCFRRGSTPAEPNRVAAVALLLGPDSPLVHSVLAPDVECEPGGTPLGHPKVGNLLDQCSQGATSVVKD